MKDENASAMVMDVRNMGPFFHFFSGLILSGIVYLSGFQTKCRLLYAKQLWRKKNLHVLCTIFVKFLQSLIGYN